MDKLQIINLTMTGSIPSTILTFCFFLEHFFTKFLTKHNFVKTSHKLIVGVFIRKNADIFCIGEEYGMPRKRVGMKVTNNRGR